MRNTPSVSSLAAPLSAFLLAGLSAAFGQTVAPPPAPAADDTESPTVQLSPFEVSTARDTGYTAADSLAGGRTNMPLKDTPAAISVMTTQFLDDIAATDFNSANFWAVNYTPTVDLAVNTSGIGGISVNYRNMGTTFASRNYFLWYIDSDSFDVERYEFARGPNAVLFGDGGAAGVATTFSKQAHFGNTSEEVESQVNSYGGYRLTADVNQPLGDRAAIRLNLLDQQGRFDYRQHTHWDREGVDLAGIVKLTSRDNLRFEVEAGDWDRSIFPETIVDQGSLWNGSASYNGTTAVANATAVGVQAIPAASGNVVADGVLRNWTSFYHTIGLGNAINLLPTGGVGSEFLHPVKLPYEGFNPQPPNIVGNTRYYTDTVYLDHRFSDAFNLELAYNRQNQVRDANGSASDNFYNQYEIDVNTVLPGGAPNPNFGQPYTDSQPFKQHNSNMVDDVRAMGNYQYHGDWLHESVSLITGSRMDRFHAFASTLQQLSNNANILVRQYWNQVGEDQPAVDLPGIAYVPTTQSWERKAIDYAQIASVSQFFHDRLTLLLGARYDNVYNSQITISVPKTIERVSAVSRNAGLVYYFVPWLGAFANYSETFQPPNTGNPLLDGSPPGISRAKGEDYGFNLNLLDGKISGSARFYQAEQDGVLQTGNNVAEVNNIWNALNEPQNQINPFRDTSDTKGKGYEIELTGNPTPELRFTFNIAFPTVTVLNVEPQLKAYVAANLATWQAAAVTNPTVQTNLGTITTRLNGLVMGAVNPGTYDYTANFLAAYSFRHGPLKNITLGGGTNVRGREIVGSYPGLPFDYVDTDAYYLLTVFASYRCHLTDKMTARFQINVTNLLNNDQLIGTAVANITTAADLAPGSPSVMLANLRIPDPRRATVSATFDF